MTATTTITTTVDSPLGPLTLSAADGFLVRLSMRGQRHVPAEPIDQRRDDAWFTDITSQLSAYFEGDLINFEVPLRLEGTEFQCDVWSHLRDTIVIRAGGKTRS